MGPLCYFKVKDHSFKEKGIQFQKDKKFGIRTQASREDSSNIGFLCKMNALCI